jgi:hypothetical protein
VAVRRDLPPDVVEALRLLHGVARASRSPEERRESWGRLVGYHDLLRGAGWKSAAVARALSVSGQSVDHAVSHYAPLPPGDGCPVPSVPPSNPRPRRPTHRIRRYLPPDVAQVLVELREQASYIKGPIEGTWRERDPRWLASREFAFRVDALSRSGYTLYGIAADIGMSYLALRNRLARHGLREAPPSIRARSASPRSAGSRP